MACFQKKDGGKDSFFRIKKKQGEMNKNEMEIIGDWMKKDGRSFVKHLNIVYALPEKFFDDFSLVLEQLRVIYAGTLVGALIRDKLVPDHALALSNLYSDKIPRKELDHEQSIRYLQRKDLNIDIKEKGWRIITHKGHSLGWINVLAGRINNYYPKELRILKDN
jgi:NOL1/NOP2/fmu family ribosome biogenesis protein